MIRKSWILWYIGKFKGAYLSCLVLFGKLIDNLVDKKWSWKPYKLYGSFDYLFIYLLLLFFWNYLDINYVFESTCNLWALCCFNSMPCVISRWSPLDLVSVVFVTMELDLGQCLFTLDDAFFPATYRGKRFLDCVWVRLLPMGPKDHKQKRSYLTHSPCCP